MIRLCGCLYIYEKFKYTKIYRIHKIFNNIKGIQNKVFLLILKASKVLLFMFHFYVFVKTRFYMNIRSLITK